jgi:hypothetical protein
MLITLSPSFQVVTLLIGPHVIVAFVDRNQWESAKRFFIFIVLAQKEGA